VTDDLTAAIERLEKTSKGFLFGHDQIRSDLRLLLSFVKAATKCFECDGELHGPFCPACNPEIKAAIEAQEAKRWCLNYKGAIADLESALDVLVSRINGEKDLASAADWVRVNYPRLASKIAPRSSPADAWLVPDGWKLVPLEPTEVMQKASRIVTTLAPDIPVGRVTTWGANVWAAMLDAAPPPPSTKGEVE
jgi:hypothetical protein